VSVKNNINVIITVISINEKSYEASHNL